MTAYFEEQKNKKEMTRLHKFAEHMMKNAVHDRKSNKTYIIPH